MTFLSKPLVSKRRKRASLVFCMGRAVIMDVCPSVTFSNFFSEGSGLITLNYISSLSFDARRNIFRLLDRGFTCLKLDGFFFKFCYKFLPFYIAMSYLIFNFSFSSLRRFAMGIVTSVWPSLQITKSYSWKSAIQMKTAKGGSLAVTTFIREKK